MIHTLLTEIGLSDKEATLYMTLLRHGTQAISFIAKKANFNRGTAYVILHNLLAKGLVTESTKTKVQYFTAIEPRYLVRYLEHRQKEIATQKEKVEAMMGQLTAIQNPLSAKPKIQFFDGIEGARFVLEDTLTAKEKTLCAFLSIFDMSAFIGADFFNDYTTQRIKKGYTLHAIRTQEKDQQAFAADIHAKRYVTSKKEKREIRHMPATTSFPITTYIYDNKIAIISSREENFALRIESRELAQLQKQLFLFIWQALQKK